MTKAPLLGSQFAATMLNYFAHKCIYKISDELKCCLSTWTEILTKRPPATPSTWHTSETTKKSSYQKTKNTPSIIKNAKCVQSYEVLIWEGQTKLLTDLTIKVKHGGYLHSDQAKGSRREKSEIHQCWAGRNKNVIFIVKNNLKKQPNKQ